MNSTPACRLPARTFLLCLLLAVACCPPACARRIHHYVFFDTARQRIHEPTFLAAKSFEGAQLKYTWKELEPEPDAYDFRALRADLAFLTARHKKLFIQLQDVTFSPSFICLPKYLLHEARFHGGAARQYRIQGDDEAHAVVEGWLARRWDKAVQERFHKLLFALGKAFDGQIEGINLPETAVEFGASGRLYPKGFNPAAYRDAILTNMAALKRAFPKSVTMQYANFMPGEWLPDQDHGYLRSVYQQARQLKVGVGGPDLQPYKPGQMRHSYPLLRASHGSIPTGVAVQEGNYEHRNPKTGKQMTIAELREFADDYLRADYMFWCTQEPFYSQKLLPFLGRAPL